MPNEIFVCKIKISRSVPVRLFIVTLTVILALAALGYRTAVKQMTEATFHDQRSDDGKYIARYAYPPRDRIALRLYRTATKELLAERGYRYPERIRLLWTDDYLIYDTSAASEDGEIELPPSWWDRVKAKLP
ncbi:MULTISPECIES: hypothetical protein [Paraburkholderia]|uniref:Uncharacterized protein n=1 Tax=Paraburkholderia podalyriae TaxID=1938811 RepID=A0ABR7PIP9_9BURK|nr:hypothetical protein [Paraburkholderia podalyriae]MBC8746155.1 hypothetical protein [Paraburkholderia podalyriae]